MNFSPLPFEGAYRVEPTPVRDHRGMFSRIFCKREIQDIRHHKDIVQVNHSLTAQRGALRGMHFQKPPAMEIKMVKCIVGAVFDVIIDLRDGSSTFLEWHGETLTPDNMYMMYIPEGFAHGFQTLEPHTELIYFHTAFYAPECEGAIRYDDPKVGIEWPLPITDISDKDRGHPLLADDFPGLKTS